MIFAIFRNIKKQTKEQYELQNNIQRTIHINPIDIMIKLSSFMGIKELVVFTLQYSPQNRRRRG